MNADCIIVGGGVTGLCTALHLRLMGLSRIVLLDRHHVGAGQSGRAAGIVRALVGNSTVSTWLGESKRFFATFSEKFGEPLTIHQDGYILLTERSSLEHTVGAIAATRSAGCVVHKIDAQEAVALQPGLRARANEVFAFEPDAIHFDAMCATQALSRAAHRLGVTIIEGCAVREITHTNGAVTGVLTDTSRFATPHILVATAAWGRQELKRLGVDVPVTPHRAEMAFFQSPPCSEWRLRRIISDARTKLYLRPEGPLQMFVGWREGDLIHSLSDCRSADPDQYKQTANFESLMDMRERLIDTLPIMKDGFAHRSYACVYDYSPDGMPILDRASDIRGLYFALGFSGGGLSLSPFVGRAMAHFMTTGESLAHSEVLRLSRFSDGTRISWGNASENSS